MEAITYLALLSVTLSGGSGKAAPAVIGTWRIKLSQEVRDVARKMGMPEPQAQFLFRADNTFAFSSATGQVKSFSGTWDGVEKHLHLSSPNNPGWTAGGIDGDLSGGDLVVDGLHYSRTGVESIAGTWLLKAGSGLDKGTKFLFKPDGTFEFKGPFATSRGRYSADGNQISLTWTEIDNEKVEGSVHKSFSFNSEGNLQIDSFTYAKS